MHVQRNYLDLAKRYLNTFPALAIIGPRQAGKTNFAKHLHSNWQYFDLEKTTDFELIKQSPELFFEQYPKNIIIDEAQELPELFKILRGVIDASRQTKGRFILTGSSSPKLMGHLTDSLAGRIGIIEMGTLNTDFHGKQPPLKSALTKITDLYIVGNTG